MISVLRYCFLFRVIFLLFYYDNHYITRELAYRDDIREDINVNGIKKVNLLVTSFLYSPVIRYTN